MGRVRDIRKFADDLERVGKRREAIAWRIVARYRVKIRILTAAVIVALGFAAWAIARAVREAMGA